MGEGNDLVGHALIENPFHGLLFGLPQIALEGNGRRRLYFLGLDFCLGEERWGVGQRYQ